MGTYLFHVKVIEVRDTRLVLKLRIITGEQPGFHSGAGFGLMLLYEPIESGMIRDAPLAGEFMFDDILNVDWLDEHVDEYIQSTKLNDVRNQPITEDLERMSSKQWREFFKSSQAPSARFEITVTRPEWIAHFEKGMEWESAAYDPLE